MMRGDDFKLCFVDRDQTAYFTSKPLAEAGDVTWGGPLLDARPPVDDPPGSLVTCTFDSGPDVSAGGVPESAMRVFSAYAVNVRVLPWVVLLDNVDHAVPIDAGTSFREFRRLIRESGGKTWVDADLVDVA